MSDPIARSRTTVLSVRRKAFAAACRFAFRLAPQSTADALIAWFMRTRRRRSSELEAMLLDDAARFSVPLDGGVIRGFSWGEGPVVYLVHGWNGSAAQLAPLATAIASAGFRAVAFDAPGHGASSGKTSSVVHLARALLAVAEVYGPARAVVAHSLGAAAVALALRRGLQADRVAMVAPAVEPVSWLRALAQEFGLSAYTRLIEERLAARVGLTGEEVSLIGHADQGAVPLLVLHDARDRETPFAGSEALVSRWPGATLVPSVGLGHTRILGAPSSRTALVGFVRGSGGQACVHGLDDGHCPTCALARGLFDRAHRAA